MKALHVPKPPSPLFIYEISRKKNVKIVFHSHSPAYDWAYNAQEENNERLQARMLNAYRWECINPATLCYQWILYPVAEYSAGSSPNLDLTTKWILYQKAWLLYFPLNRVSFHRYIAWEAGNIYVIAVRPLIGRQQLATCIIHHSSDGRFWSVNLADFPTTSLLLNVMSAVNCLHYHICSLSIVFMHFPSWLK